MFIVSSPLALPSPLSTHLSPLCLSLPQVSSLIGNEGDATPFGDVTVSHISKTLHELGYQDKGWEVMYHGHTGERAGEGRGWMRKGEEGEHSIASFSMTTSSPPPSTSQPPKQQPNNNHPLRLPPGRQLQAQIFLNPTYYQRLKHMVDFKIHSRGRGPLQVEGGNGFFHLRPVVSRQIVSQ